MRTARSLARQRFGVRQPSGAFATCRWEHRHLCRHVRRAPAGAPSRLSKRQNCKRRGWTWALNPVRGDLCLAAHVLRDNPNPIRGDLENEEILARRHGVGVEIWRSLVAIDRPPLRRFFVPLMGLAHRLAVSTTLSRQGAARAAAFHDPAAIALTLHES